MWRYLRPDASGVWKNPEVVRRLSRYRDIIDNKRWAKYLLAKDVCCDTDLEASSDELWERHKALSLEHEDYVRTVDKEGIEFRRDEVDGVSLLSIKAELAHRILQSCHFCERKCGVNRTKDEKGWCKLDADSWVSSYFLHSGEEAPLVPSGTIFFASCCFGCVFCQNEDISTNPNAGRVVSAQELADIAEHLYQDGALNINYVGGDPIPNTHTIVESMLYQSSNVTQLWNSNLYCSMETMKLLSDLIDVWLPDFKYGNNECGRRLSGVTEYFDIVSRNHKIAYEHGEVIVRHLVMPNHVECCTIPILEWIAENMPLCMVNIMGQYRPEHKVRRRPQEYPDISRRVNQSELKRAFEKADELGVVYEPVS